MDIAIIGTGNVGKALGSSLVRAGHNVTFSASNPQHATDAAADVGARAAASNNEAVNAADLVILAIPATALGAVATEIGASAAGKVVVDVSNRPTPDPAGAPTSIAEELQAQLPGSSVVKAFNTAFAVRQADPVVDGIQLDGFVAGDDGDGKTAVLELVESAGFRPIDVGPLPMARTLEALGWLNIQLQIRNGWPWQGGWKFAGPSEASRATVSAARR